MPIVYRTTGAWGAGKGSNLTPTEVDENMKALVDQISAVVAQEPIEISSITSLDGALTVHLADGSTFGPFTMPTAKFNPTGAWATATAYKVGDLFTQNDTLYYVQINHTSASPFDAGASNMVGTYAVAIMPFPSNFSIGLSFPGKPGFGISVGEAMWSYRFDRNIWLPQDLVASVGGLFVAPAVNQSWSLYKNTTLIGSMAIALSATVATFTFAANVQFASGDVLRVKRMDTLDANARDLTMTLKGNLGTIPV